MDKENMRLGVDVSIDALQYHAGFGNEHASEAIPGTLPIGRNSPQRPAWGLFAEQINGTSFTAPRNSNRRTWMYRICPSAAAQQTWSRLPHQGLDEDLQRLPASPSRYCWLPWRAERPGTDFIDALTRVAQSGGASEMRGIAIYAFCANASMSRLVFSNCDAEMIIIVQRGALQVTTELGRLRAAAGEILVLPRALRFSAAVASTECVGFACENFGAPFRLPDLGPIGANGLALPRDFLAPTAWFEDDPEPVQSVCKYGGVTWSSILRRSPFDVVAWHGNHVPYKYDLRRFNAVQSVTWDHSDPSIFAALTSPSSMPGTANADICVIPPRWIVADDTFRPPYFHRNVMSEFVVSIDGTPESRGNDYQVGSSHLHNRMSPHGPDPDVFLRAFQDELQPVRDHNLMVLIESESPFSVAPQALASPRRVVDYEENWQRMPIMFAPPQGT